MLLAALLRSLGHKVRFNTVSTVADGEFTHVFPEVFDRNSGEWMALDTTVRRSYPGWRPSKVTRERDWYGLGQANDTGGPAVMTPPVNSSTGLVLLGLGVAALWLLGGRR